MNLLDRLLHRRKDEVVSDNTWLVVGLGNPGAQYAGNRHNVGQMVADELASRIGATFKSHKTPSRVAEGFLGPGRPKLVLAKPNSYMNTSGGPVSALLKFYSLPIDRLIVVHDELDIPFDTVRLKRGGGHGGHNGLRDIQKAAGSPEFTRVRVGIGRPRVAWTPPTTCSATSPGPSARRCRTCWRMPRTPWSRSSPTGSWPRSSASTRRPEPLDQAAEELLR